MDCLFLGHADDFCPDCSNPVLSLDLSKPPNEMVFMLWHDEMCPLSPVAKARNREVAYR
ncbi:hypothetical protein ACIO14_14905 [Nocardia fluminea]|uniref:hypothetical protein n=1 Tax=Nocardia fluminea TaxID=134984 RepID=UPI00381863C1